MGKIDKGVLGGFSGKVGTVVGSNWKGVDTMRSRPPRKRRGQASDLQLVTQAKFLLMTKFLRPLTALLTQTYKKTASRMTPFNKAFSHNILQAITGVYPTLTVDYAKILLSRGSLPGVDGGAALSTVAGQLVFNWKDNSGVYRALISDMVFVAAYSPDLDRWISNQNVAARNVGTCTLDVTPFAGKPVQTYIGFMSANGNIVSDSLYTGLVNVL